MRRELQNEKEQNQQTIESLEKFSLQLKTEGEIQQSEIEALRKSLYEATDKRAASEFKLMQTTEDNAYNMKEIEELQEQQRTLKRQLFKTDCELQMLRMQQASEQE